MGCGGGGCHQNSPNTTISLTGIPASGYVNGVTYSMTLTVSNALKSKAGFNLTVNQGGLTAGAGMNINGSQELKHSTPLQMISNVATWSFDWTAPVTGTSPVIFFIAGNAVDGNNNSSNDEFETTQAQFSAASTTSPPSVTNVLANNITSSEATINANVNANGDPTSVSVEYGLTASYGSTMAATPAVVTGSVVTPTSTTLNGLQVASIYHYRIKATNTLGTTYSPDAIFNTLPTALSEIESIGIKLYPNPTTNIIHYQDESEKQSATFNVVDILGHQQAIRIVNMEEGQYKIDVSSLSKGNYFLLIKRNSNTTLFYYRFTKE